MLRDALDDDAARTLRTATIGDEIGGKHSERASPPHSYRRWSRTPWPSRYVSCSAFVAEWLCRARLVEFSSSDLYMAAIVDGRKAACFEVAGVIDYLLIATPRIARRDRSSANDQMTVGPAIVLTWGSFFGPFEVWQDGFLSRSDISDQLQG